MGHPLDEYNAWGVAWTNLQQPLSAMAYPAPNQSQYPGPSPSLARIFASYQLNATNIMNIEARPGTVIPGGDLLGASLSVLARSWKNLPEWARDYHRQNNAELADILERAAEIH